MAEIAFTWDPKDLDVWRDQKVARAVAGALSKAGSGGIRAVRVAGSRLIRQRKRFRVARVNKGMMVLYPQNKQVISEMAWSVRVSGRPVPLIELPHRQTRRGVSVEVNRGQRKLIKSAFVARLRSGHEGVFRRTGKGRLPIREAFTTRLTDVFQDDQGGAAMKVLDVGQAKLARDFDRLFPLELDKVQ